MIEVRELTKRYGGRRGFVAIEDITLTVRSGSVFGLVGYNGAGKTTLLKTIAGVYRPSAGKVYLNGRAGPPAAGELLIVADEPYFLPQASTNTMARFYGGYYPAFSPAVFERLLAAFGLEACAPIEGFSKGMARQCAIALGLASGGAGFVVGREF